MHIIRSTDDQILALNRRRLFLAERMKFLALNAVVWFSVVLIVLFSEDVLDTLVLLKKLWNFRKD